MSDDSEYITAFCEGDEEEINTLYNEVFGGQRSLEEWRWKFRTHPFPELTMINKLVQKGRIIGHVGTLPGQFKVGDKLVFGGQIVDYFIHPGLQLGKRITHINQELNTRMVDTFVERGMAFGYGFPNALSYPIAMKYLKGAEDVTEVPIWKKWLRPPPSPTPSREDRSSALLRSLYARGMWQFREMKLSRRSVSDSGFVFSPLSRPEQRLDDLWQEASKHIGNARVRDQKHLAWRFFNKPGKAYSFWLLHDKGVPMAYAVMATKGGDFRTGYVIDFLFRTGRGIPESLFNRVMQQMAHDKIDVVKCLTVANSSVADLLEKLGFQPEPEGVKMIGWIHPPAIDRSHFFDSSHWHITYADLDGT